MAQHKKNINIFWFISLTISLLAGCSQNHLSTDGLPVIDVTKSYPEKDFRLTDIADITYVHLDSKHDDFLYRGSIRYITENTLVVNDAVTNSFLFFSKDGAPKSFYNRFGNDPEEYWGMGGVIVYIELKQAYRENKLSGKLNELVATLNEDEDNNVFMLVHFKS